MKNEYKYSTSISVVFGELFSIYRKKLNLTQKDFAEALGLGTANISKIESGDTVISIEQLFAISMFLQKKPSDIIKTSELIIEKLRENKIFITSAKLNKMVVEEPIVSGFAGAIAAATPVIGWAVGGAALVNFGVCGGYKKQITNDLFNHKELITNSFVKGKHIHSSIIEVIDGK